MRKRCLLEGFQEALRGMQRGPGTVRKLLDGRQEAELIAMRLCEPPKGFGSWSLRLLAKQAVELEIVDSVSHETVGRTLKRNGISGRKLQYWVIPPKANGEYAAAMEEVLHTYERPRDEKCPVICMDEQPIQLIKETRLPLPETREHPQRVDYEYKRAGTASVFLFCEPLAGWRSAHARNRRTKLDWAQEVAHLLEGRYADCEKVTLVLDNLNTHTKGALYEAFEPERARRLAERIEFCYTPKHGSWLNIAECELSSMTRQCLRGRRIGDLETLQGEIEAWSTSLNQSQRGVDWHMTVDEARRKLKSVYPKILL